MFREIFKKVKESRGITGKAISEVTGISQNHISKFLSAERDVTTETLWRMVKGMDIVSPGAEQEFFQDLTGHTGRLSLKQIVANAEPQDLLQVMGNSQFAALISAFAETLKQEEPNETPENGISSLRKSPHDSKTPTVYKEVMVS
jgi:transcriptional regulator with XRE-family HTH domain